MELVKATIILEGEEKIYTITTEGRITSSYLDIEWPEDRWGVLERPFTLPVSRDRASIQLILRDCLGNEESGKIYTLQITDKENTDGD